MTDIGAAPPAVDVAVIGAGPAGLLCARELSRAGRSVVIFEGQGPGGQLLEAATLEGLPGLPTDLAGWDLAAALLDEVLCDRVRLQFDAVSRLRTTGGAWEIEAGSGEAATARAVVLATGTQPIPLDVPGAEALLGRGLSYCAECDGPLFGGERVAVVGSSADATRDAKALMAVAAEVLVIGWHDARGRLVNAAHVADESGARLLEGTQVTGLEGGERLEAIRCLTGEGHEERIPVSAVFSAIGRRPSPIPVQGPGQGEEKDELPPFAVDRTLAVKGFDGLFAAGETRADAPRRLTSAFGDGAQAAASAVQWLDNRGQT